jgi:hypothetical protein
MEIVFGLGAAVLGGAIAWAMIRNRHRNPDNDAITEAATRAEYKQPDSYDPQQFRRILKPNVRK